MFQDLSMPRCLKFSRQLRAGNYLVIIRWVSLSEQRWVNFPERYRNHWFRHEGKNRVPGKGCERADFLRIFAQATLGQEVTPEVTKAGVLTLLAP